MEVMMKRLEEASMEGNVTTLLELIREDPLILDRQIVGCYNNETPLHISSMLGHLDFTNEILSRKPQLAIETNSQTKSTPLHLAAAKGYVEIVKSLLKVNPDVCFAIDRNGMNPSHVAAIKGKVGVLKELVKARASCVKVMIEKGVEKESIMHLCVKYDQFEALEFLVKTIGGDDELVKIKDGDGNTILHLAVVDKKIETIKFIISNTKVDVNATNANGYTAFDILANNRRYMNDMLISESLQLVGALRSNHLSSPSNSNAQSIRTHAYNSDNNQIGNNWEHLQKKDWLEKKRNVLMLVASLIATMAFTAGLNPVGGVWQETSQGSLESEPHTAGLSIMADNYPLSFQGYLILNTTSFISALSIILLLISGLPLNRKFFVWVFMVIMWTSITTLALTYLIAIGTLDPSSRANTVLVFVVYVWLGLMGLILLVHTIRLIVKMVKKLVRSVRRRGPVSNTLTMMNDNNA